VPKLKLIVKLFSMELKDPVLYKAKKSQPVIEKL
jgi:hypothetical protein